MLCPNCGAENPEGRKYCGDCGRIIPPPLPFETKHSAWRDIYWLPLLIVIAAVYLNSLAVYNAGSGYGHEIEYRLTAILSFLASLFLIWSIALVIYSREDRAKRLLVVGMIILLIQLAIRAEVLLRVSL